MRYFLVVAMCFLLASAPVDAQSLRLESVLQDRSLDPSEPPGPRMQIAQRGGGMSLSQAIESVRRRGNVDRIIDAQTRVSGDREVHHIKVLTKDGKVKTHTVQGRKRN